MMMPNHREKVPVDLPLADFVAWAWKQSRESDHYQPAAKPYRTTMWDFVRALTAHLDLRGLPAAKALQLVQQNLVFLPILNKQLSLPDMFPASGDPIMEFLAAWEKVRVPAGEDILVLAYGLADEYPVKLQGPHSEQYQAFVSIAYHLQLLRPGDYINLPVERLSALLRVDPRTISNYRQHAEKAGLLLLIQKHHQPSGTATKFVFNVGRFNLETGADLGAEENDDFHKDYEDNKESDDREDIHEVGKKSRSNEELERQEGLSGSSKDTERKAGTRGGANSPKLQQTKETLKNQAALLERKFASR